MEKEIEFNYSDITNYLSTGAFPANMKGNRGLKANFKRKASRFALKEGALFFNHKAHRNDKEGKVMNFKM